MHVRNVRSGAPTHIAASIEAQILGQSMRGDEHKYCIAASETLATALESSSPNAPFLVIFRDVKEAVQKAQGKVKKAIKKPTLC